MSRVIQAAVDNGASFEEVKDLAQQLGTAYEATSGGADALATATGGATDANHDLSDATDENEAAQVRLTTAFDRAKAASERLTNAEHNRYQQIEDQFDTGLALEDAVNDTSDALDRAYEAWRDFGSGSEEAERAYNDALQSASAQADAAVADAEARNGDVELSDRQRADAQIASLQDVASHLAPNSEIRQRLDEYIFTLASVPRDVQTNIQAQVDWFVANHINPNYGTNTEVLTISGKKAAGGPVTAGGTYVVGENGPELLRMGSNSGTIVPNDKLPAGQTVININGYQQSPRELVDEMMWQLALKVG